MHDDEVAALVERIVTGARIAYRGRRDELRRELIAHFEDAAASPDGRDDAVTRFGQEQDVIHSLRRIYAFEYVLVYLVKLLASIAGSLAAALAIEWAVNLRIAPRPLLFALATVVTIVVAWELARPPAGVLRAALARRPLFIIFASFAVVEFVIHWAKGIHLAPSRAILAAVVLTIVSASTLVIAATADRAFISFFDAS